MPQGVVATPTTQTSNEYSLEKVLNEAAMVERTVILTTLNEAWAAPNSVIDLFLVSFRIGDHTRSFFKPFGNHCIGPKGICTLSGFTYPLLFSC